MPEKEATARIKINRLLEAAGWRFLPDGDQASNIRLEPSVMITSSDLAAVGDSKDRFLFEMATGTGKTLTAGAVIKLGLTATPRDYLRRFDRLSPGTRDPREAERRLLLDTYRTFGCDNS